MKSLLFTIGLMAYMSLAVANPSFSCHGTYENSDGLLFVVPNISATSSGEVSMEYMNKKALCPSTVVDARTIRMMCGASSLVGSVSADCETLTVNGRPYYLKQ
jgi:hypothetical protein